MTVHPYYLNTLSRHVQAATWKQNQWNLRHDMAPNSSVWFAAALLALIVVGGGLLLLAPLS